MTRAGSSGLADVARQIAGYDPFETAGACSYDKKAAREAIAFFSECLTFTAGEWMGQPFKLEPWQRCLVAHLFGWKRHDGRRRYREAFIYVPRKNGKSELAGGLGNLLAFADDEPGAQVYCAAAAREQARLVFNATKRMVLAEPELARRSHVYSHAITVPATGSVLKVISAEARPDGVPITSGDAPATEASEPSGLVFDDLVVTRASCAQCIEKVRPREPP